MAHTKTYKTIFFGTPEFSVPTLQALINDERFDVVAVVTAPDKPVGRKQVMTPPPVKVVAQEHGIPVLQPATLKGVPLSRLGEVSEVRADIVVTIAYGLIVPQAILDIPKYGCLNLHASLLPRHRGASPIQTAIAAGDTQTGVTLMKMDAGMDTGPMIATEKINIIPTDTGKSLHDKLSELSTHIALTYIPQYLTGDIKAQPQDDALATVAPKLTRDSGRIDWQKSAAKTERLVRAYCPWPGTWSMWSDKKLKIISATGTVDSNAHAPGTVFLHNNKLAVQCGNGALIIERLQLEGKRIMSSKEFLQGQSNILNQILQ